MKRWYIETYRNGRMKRWYYATVEEASEVADTIFRRTGVVVGIEEEEEGETDMMPEIELALILFGPRPEDRKTHKPHSRNIPRRPREDSWR